MEIDSIEPLKKFIQEVNQLRLEIENATRLAYRDAFEPLIDTSSEFEYPIITKLWAKLNEQEGNYASNALSSLEEIDKMPTLKQDMLFDLYSAISSNTFRFPDIPLHLYHTVVDDKKVGFKKPPIRRNEVAMPVNFKKGNPYLGINPKKSEDINSEQSDRKVKQAEIYIKPSTFTNMAANDSYGIELASRVNQDILDAYLDYIERNPGKQKNHKRLVQTIARPVIEDKHVNENFPNDEKVWLKNNDKFITSSDGKRIVYPKAMADTIIAMAKLSPKAVLDSFSIAPDVGLNLKIIPANVKAMNENDSRFHGDGSIAQDLEQYQQKN